MSETVNRTVFPLGLPDPNIRIIGSGLSDAATLGSGAVAATIAVTGTGLDDQVATGSGNLFLTISLSGTGLVDAPTFGDGVISTAITVVDDETDTFLPSLGSGQVSPGPVSLAGTGLADPVSYGVGIATIGGITVIDDEDDAFTPTLGGGSVQATISTAGTGLSDQPTLGDGVVQPGVVTLGGTFTPAVEELGQGSLAPTRYYFVGPTLRYGHGRRNSHLWWVENPEGVSLLKIDGQWIETLAPTDDELATAQASYRGGYRTELTGTQKAELVSAGYGSYIEED